MESENTVTAREVAAAFGIAIATVYRLAEEGRIPAEKVKEPWLKKRRWRFHLSDVAAAIAKMATDDPPSGTP